MTLETSSAIEAGIAVSFASPILRQAAAALAAGDLRQAERLARARLTQQPGDLAATIVLSDIAGRVGIYAEAERLLRSVLLAAPDYANATINLALALFPQGQASSALAMLDALVAKHPGNIRAASTKADIEAQVGDYAQAEATYRGLLAQVDDRADVWMWFGHLLKTTGRQEEAVAAYRHAGALDADLAEAWWSLAELKANRIGQEDLAAIEQALARAVSAEKRVFLQFALGKAYEDQRDWARSFEHYAAGNALRLAREPHDRAAVSAEVDRSTALYTPSFFERREGWGRAARDPIFIVGLPRSGSTLVEQILSSHSRVEGTAELPDIPLIAQALVAERWQDPHAAFPDVTETLSRARVTELGERYLASARRHCKTDKPCFIDKLPNNWRYLGLIRLLLPNARIIDARREPMACCFSNFKQHFARGQTFAYSLDDVGAYYRDYVRAMQHFELAAPGAVHRVQHEALLADTEHEIKRLLAFLDLPFEEACLRPHENRRAVRTASSEQVRRPINRDAIDQWRHFEPWLGPLKAALGDLASAVRPQ